MGSVFSGCTVENTITSSSEERSSHSTVKRGPALKEWSVADPKEERQSLRGGYITIRQNNSNSNNNNNNNLTSKRNNMRPRSANRPSYFRNYTRSKGLLYGCAIIYVVSCSIVSICQPLFVDCSQTAVVSDFENPGYAFDQPCHHTRDVKLLFLTPQECAFGRRIVFATIFGAMIGWERRQADRPAGIRTMSLVSLGSCLFSICGTFAFIDGPMGWDASRISAAIPSGVGFLGAGIIWKQSDKDTNMQTVHGLTTAASLWLSAAVGIACSGELYFAASFAIAVMMILLRFGPRIIIGDEARDFSSERDVNTMYDLESQESSLQTDIWSKENTTTKYNTLGLGEGEPDSPVKSVRSARQISFGNGVKGRDFDVPSLRD